MPWLSRSKSSKDPISPTNATLVPAIVLAQLPNFGRASFNARKAGRSVTDPQFSWETFLSPFSAAFTADASRAIRELEAAAGTDNIARFGAAELVSAIDGSRQDQQYLELLDSVLQLMYEEGLSSGHMTGYERDRWVKTHGDVRLFDRIVEVEVPSGLVAELTLPIGESLKVAQLGPADIDNQFWLERLQDGRYAAFSMREWSDGDGYLTRCEEAQVVNSLAVEETLRSLGELLRRRPFWAHGALDPYFPEVRT